MQDNELAIKRHEYMEYIKEHIMNVQLAFIDLKEYKNNVVQTYLLQNPQLLQDIYNRIIVHDKSKYSDEEFEPYRINYFPVNEEEKETNKEAYNKAWEHHYKNNDHHWQNRENTDILNRAACWEMILDWWAMGIKFKDKCWEYYEENKNTIHLNELETEYVETILNAIKQEDIENGYKGKEE